MKLGDKIMIGCIIGLFCTIVSLPIIFGIKFPKDLEKAENILNDQTGLKIQKVTINSPSFYIELDSIADFKEAIKKQKADVIYTNGAIAYSRFYVVFNEDYSIGYRIRIHQILEDVS